MRVLTVISGIVISACGAFCFAFNGNLFVSVAFVIGVTMVISGACNTGAYVISGRGSKRLTETTLVEGLVTLLYGVAVLNNQVTDAFLTLFFGTWLTVCGVTRVSQSFYVSRFNPKDWAKIIPLAAIATMMGIVMMMPQVLVSVSPLMLVGGAFVFDGLSMLTYAMYMKQRSTGGESEQKAKERAAARKELEKADRLERERLRKLTKKERSAEIERLKREKQEEEKARKAAIKAQKEAEREAARPDTEKTTTVSAQEVAEINKIVEAKEAEVSEETVAPIAPVVPEVEEPQTRAAWQRPTDIPLVKTEEKEVKESQKLEDTSSSLNLKAVNLDEIEANNIEVAFEKVELPEFTLSSTNQSANREEVLDDIQNTKIEVQTIDYKPISLEDLINEPLRKNFDPKDAKRFTQTLNFGWLEEELK